jgi:two-component SAPR family response regulator
MMENTPQAEPGIGVSLGSYEEAAVRIRDLNNRIIESMKAAGSTSLEAYEKALEGLIGLEVKAADASQLEWVSAIAEMHTNVVRDVSGAYTKATRELLNSGAQTT